MRTAHSVSISTAISASIPNGSPVSCYIGVAVPVGRLSAEQMRAIADDIRYLGSGDIRLTVWQNLILPDIRQTSSEPRGAIADSGLSDSVATFAAGVVACTGNTGCRFSATDTKAHALALVGFLGRAIQIAQPINLHVTGCPHSCAQHYIGDIGLLGTKVGGEEGYQVLVGGGSDERQGLGRELVPAVRSRICHPSWTSSSDPFSRFARNTSRSSHSPEGTRLNN